MGPKEHDIPTTILIMVVQNIHILRQQNAPRYIIIQLTYIHKTERFIQNSLPFLS